MGKDGFNSRLFFWTVSRKDAKVAKKFKYFKTYKTGPIRGGPDNYPFLLCVLCGFARLTAVFSFMDRL